MIADAFGAAFGLAALGVLALAAWLVGSDSVPSPAVLLTAVLILAAAAVGVGVVLVVGVVVARFSRWLHAPLPGRDPMPTREDLELDGHYAVWPEVRR